MEPPSATALFVVGGGVLADRAACSLVVDFGPQVAAGIGHSDLVDRSPHGGR